jgi:endonuclease/exonuclease/phosphatase family metal-dependent hydrolase
MSNTPRFSVMTYNIRYDNTYDQGTRSWLYRRQSVVDLIKKNNPDILCLQEAMENQYDYIRECLGTAYMGVGLARDYDPVTERHIGEYAPIIIKVEKFEIADRETFWLSDTPHLKGSKSWDSCCTRICTWCKLKFKEVNGQYVFVFNTHWDHIGVQARCHSSDIIKNEMSNQLRHVRYEDPSAKPIIIMTGDLNCVPQTEELQKLFIPLVDDASKIAIKLQNTKTCAKEICGPAETFTDFDFSLVIEIDYVLWQQGIGNDDPGKWCVAKYEVIPDVVKEEYESDEEENYDPEIKTYVPSDHRPIVVQFTLQ